MADVQVHAGTMYYEGGTGREVVWVETRIRLKLTRADLVTGLGNEYFRDETSGDSRSPCARPESLPDHLSRRRLLAICREQFEYYGWSWDAWGHELNGTRREAARGWLDELVRDAVPGIEDEGTYVETALVLQPQWFNLVDALGSRYLRSPVAGWRVRPTELPSGLTRRQLLTVFREEMTDWGTAMAAWTDAVPEGAVRVAHRWLKELVADTFPEMKEYMT